MIQSHRLLQRLDSFVFLYQRESLLEAGPLLQGPDGVDDTAKKSLEKLMKQYYFCSCRNWRTPALSFPTTCSIASATKGHTWKSFVSKEAVFFWCFLRFCSPLPRRWVSFNGVARLKKSRALKKIGMLQCDRTSVLQWRLHIQTGHCCSVRLDTANKSQG